MSKIAIVGDKEVAKSLCRAIGYIDHLRHTFITRFILSFDINSAIELCNLNDFYKKTTLSDLSLIIIANREERDNLSLIRDIRFSIKENFDNSGIPIILLTTVSLFNTQLTPEQTVYLHLRDNGTALSIPFTLESLHDCLKRALYFDDELLQYIKNSFRRSALIHEYSHGMNKDNYKERLEDIIAVVPNEYKEQVRNLRDKEYNRVITEIEELKKEIEEKEKKEDIYNET